MSANCNTRSTPPQSFHVCTGNGSGDTHALTLSNGQPNRHTSAGTAYRVIDWDSIVALAGDPVAVAKTKGPWVIPSAYAGPDARSHSVQRQHGHYWMLAADIDTGSPSLRRVKASVRKVFGNTEWLVYATASAERHIRKWRVLVPLSHRLLGAFYKCHQQVFFDRLGLEVDHALERPGQLIYLPNRGNYYDWYLNPGPRWQMTGEFERDAMRRYAAEEKAQRENPEATPSDIHEIARFNSEYEIPDLLEFYGYETQDGINWRSPMQRSGSYATRSFGSYWVSLSESDKAAGLGRETFDGFVSGDAFDLYAFFAFSNNMGHAIADLRLEYAAADRQGLADAFRRNLNRSGLGARVMQNIRERMGA